MVHNAALLHHKTKLLEIVRADKRSIINTGLLEISS